MKPQPFPDTLPHSAPLPRHDQALRPEALRLLQLCDINDKATQVQNLVLSDWPIDPTQELTAPGPLPGRSDKPVLVHPSQLKTRAVGTLEGRAGLIHALTHIEANAIDLALDMVWRFSDLPEAFYRDWWRVAAEEALHYQLLNQHLNTLGHHYGDFPAHDGLWDMAERTKGDVLARLALVPRTLEARGLDATPAVRNRLVSVGDMAAAKVLDIILRDEIGHVGIGNHWYRHLCTQRQLDPVHTYADLARRFEAPVLKGPFNLSARRAAGFTDEELNALALH